MARLVFNPEMSNLNRCGKYSENRRILEAFAESGEEWAELVEFSQTSAKICQTSLMTSAKRYHLYSIRVHYSKGRVFLHNESIKK